MIARKVIVQHTQKCRVKPNKFGNDECPHVPTASSHQDNKSDIHEKQLYTQITTLSNRRQHGIWHDRHFINREAPECIVKDDDRHSSKKPQLLDLAKSLASHSEIHNAHQMVKCLNG